MFPQHYILVHISAQTDLVSSGRLLASCDDLSVTLQPVSRQGERRAVALSGSSDMLSFSFENVLPGKYKGQKHLPFIIIVITSVICILLFHVIVIFIEC